MRISQTDRLTALLALAVSLLFSGSLFADSVKTISRTIDIALASSVEIEASVAEMDIEFYDGELIELEIEVEAERNWLSWRRGNVDDVELKVNSGDENIYLGIPDRKIQQHWRVRMPASLAVAISVGVGDLDLKNLSNNLEMDVGVGSVRVTIGDANYGMIRASSGVGDSSIRGFGHETDNERSFVSSDSYYHGSGELEVNIEVGVGDTVVRRR
ncbi:MAG: hypothetical protein WDZ52_07255 [Pseudohongiellaceae bacterium]